jgi:hypothetical protein
MNSGAWRSKGECNAATGRRGPASLSRKPFAKPQGDAVLVLGGTLETPPKGGTSEIQAFQLYGLSSPAVVGVDLVLRNGLRVTATLRHGVWGM